MRRIDDSLLLPRAPRVRARRRECDAKRIYERTKLRATLPDELHAIGERVTAAGAHLGFGCDQLTDEVRLDLGADRRLLHVFEAVDKAERPGVEQGKLLFHRDGEVRNL